jgi:hypothetical protein
MTNIGIQMLDSARRARGILPPESLQRITGFVLGRVNKDGGFLNRSNRSDLYYSIFGMQCLAVVLQTNSGIARLVRTLRHVLLFRRIGGYVSTQASRVDALDFVHLSCLARCLAAVRGGHVAGDVAITIARRAEEYRTGDGGYHVAKNAGHGTAYACFLALLIYEALGVEIPHKEGILKCIRRLVARDGGYANEPCLPVGTTTTTSAVCLILSALGESVDSGIADWLRARCVNGGFLATPDSPIPDLLSTATALHALAIIKQPMKERRDSCVDFVESLWHENGGFFGTQIDSIPDCEYTFYALLALGNLV